MVFHLGSKTSLLTFVGGVFFLKICGRWDDSLKFMFYLGIVVPFRGEFSIICGFWIKTHVRFGYTLWLFNIAMEAMALIEIDDFPSERNLHA